MGAKTRASDDFLMDTEINSKVVYLVIIMVVFQFYIKS